ncbi:MAG: Glutamyl-Q tRNA(Asp) synthetase Glu-Q-RS [Bacteroidetes bacterium]|nr:MAG: Glutamyl-Q tRNA(Asp) synthetase Glu-Q-RS [Bacteroidota bacterium]
MVFHSRLAPTPSGYLHLGNAFSFLLTWLLVRRSRGKLLLRIDDLDAERKRPEYVADIFESLSWLGITYDEGPLNPDDFEQHWSQRLRVNKYNETLHALHKTGKVFACSCTRSQLANLSPGSRYPDICLPKNLPFDQPDTAERFHIPESPDVTFTDSALGKISVPLGRRTGSFVIRRRDGIPAYHVASLTDDRDFGINFIVRGSDLIPSTAAQIVLADALGWTDFRNNVFIHHPLLTDSDGNKLSKSEGALALKTMRNEGAKPKDIYRKFAISVGLPETGAETMEELLESFGDFDPAEKFKMPNLK